VSKKQTKEEKCFITFLKEILRRRKRLPSQLARDLSISHATVSRWLSGIEVPNIQSCRKMAELCGIPLEEVLASAGHLPKAIGKTPVEWPEFREYAKQKYPNELDEDLITMIEDLIERRRSKKNKTRGGKVKI
jgi:transcriptional regulator with XRE-family HTH domain